MECKPRRTPFVCPLRTIAGMVDTIEDTLGARLKAARKAKHLTQVQAGGLLGGKTHAAIGQWERNEVIPETENLIAAAELYAASLDWLVWGGAMGSGIESRLRKIPDILRPGLVQRLHEEIDKTEEAAKRLPDGMASPPAVVKDRDERLRPWSAKEKLKAAARAKAKGGTQ